VPSVFQAPEHLPATQCQKTVKPPESKQVAVGLYLPAVAELTKAYIASATLLN
jgi:hypothetical protein